MNMDRREWLGRSVALVGAAGGLSVGLPAAAQGFVEGRHYQRLPTSVPVSTPPGKIEVLEFFSYACPHCNAFEPSLAAWVKKLPADVVFRRVPVNFLQNHENFARLYYSLEALGQADALQAKVFTAFHVERNRLPTPEAIADFVVKNGVDRAKFTALFNSFGVQTKLGQVPGLVSAFKIDGVPTLGIQGRFTTSPSMAGSEGMTEDMLHTRALQLADQLIAQARKG